METSVDSNGARQVISLDHIPIEEAVKGLESVNRTKPHKLVSGLKHAKMNDLQMKLSLMLHSTPFAVGLGAIILFNLIVAVLETDWRASAQPNAEMPLWIVWVSHLFLLVYSVELALRLYVERRDFFKNNTNRVDFCIVIADVMCSVLAGVWESDNMPSPLVLRMIRLVRLSRAARVLKSFRQLHLMLLGLVAAMKAISWAAVLLFVVITLWSIIAVEVIHPLNVKLAEDGAYPDCERCGRAFESVLQANLTFIQQIIAGDSWGKITIPIIEYKPWTAFLFLSVLLTVQLGLLNLILTVIVDSAAEARENDIMQKLKDKQKRFGKEKWTLRELVEVMDVDLDGKITLEELLDAYDKIPDFSNLVTMMDVKREDLPAIFELMDVDDSGDVEYCEFIEELHKMNNQDTATVLAFMRHNLQQIKKSTQESLRLLREELLENCQTQSLRLDALLGVYDRNGMLNPLVQVQPSPAAKDSWDLSACSAAVPVEEPMPARSISKGRFGKAEPRTLPTAAKALVPLELQGETLSQKAGAVEWASMLQETQQHFDERRAAQIATTAGTRTELPTALSTFLNTLQGAGNNCSNQDLATAKEEKVREVKEKFGYIAQDYEKELGEASSNTDMEKTYEHGNVMTITAERIKCPEVPFHPFLISKESGGILQWTFDSIQ